MQEPEKREEYYETLPSRYSMAAVTVNSYGYLPKANTRLGPDILS